MERRCAWCQKRMGTVQAEAFSENVITHGMCEECMLKMASGMTKTIDDFLDTLECPVLMLEDDNTMATANQQACEVMGKTREEIAGKRPGDVLECPYSKEPGGCGLQVHCKSCVIRKSVKKTFETGEACRAVPAIPDLQQFINKKETAFLISTERVGKMVLLKVEKVTRRANPELKENKD